MALARDRVVIPTDVTTGAVTTGVVITGMTFPVNAARTYRFKVALAWTVAATTTGIGINVTATGVTTAATFFASQLVAADGTGTLDGGGIAAYAAAGASSGGAGVITPIANSSATAGNFGTLEGIFTAAATQVIQIEVLPEAAAAVTVKAGSFVEWELLL